MLKPDEKFPYEDIVDMPHHVSEKRPKMSMTDRAAQFSPFAALTGYEDAIKETARLTEEMCILDEDSKAELDRKLRELTAESKENREVSITYFQPDEKKSGGAYITTVGKIKKIDDVEHAVHLNNGKKIPIDFIVNVERATLEIDD